MSCRCRGPPPCCWPAHAAAHACLWACHHCAVCSPKAAARRPSLPPARAPQAAPPHGGAGGQLGDHLCGWGEEQAARDCLGWVGPPCCCCCCCCCWCPCHGGRWVAAAAAAAGAAVRRRARSPPSRQPALQLPSWAAAGALLRAGCVLLTGASSSLLHHLLALQAGRPYSIWKVTDLDQTCVSLFLFRCGILITGHPSPAAVAHGCLRAGAAARGCPLATPPLPSLVAAAALTTTCGGRRRAPLWLSSRPRSAPALPLPCPCLLPALLLPHANTGTHAAAAGVRAQQAGALHSACQTPAAARGCQLAGLLRSLLQVRAEGDFSLSVDSSDQVGCCCRSPAETFGFVCAVHGILWAPR